MKKNLYITSNLELKRDGNCIKIEDKKLPISMIDNVLIMGNASLTTGARNLLLKNNRSIFFMNYKYETIGILTPPLGSDYRFRIKQYQNQNNIEIAKLIVNKKIEAIEEFSEKSLNRYKKKLQEVDNLQSILGVEGSASTYMFEKFKNSLNEMMIFDFTSRSYRPVKDKINGLLSFLYTMYYNFLFAEVVGAGFDAYIGFLHIKRGRHCALVSDLMEEARVYLTKLAIEILDEIYQDGFEGLYLTNEARKFVIKKFDEFIISYENNLIKEVKEKLC